ncbi:MAG TPA: BBP7 family outer membrane beta-barrel protein, partial [Gemmataceae bacterium]|nr:BBP7 family outer membrane beta-barrel protein [Gemmataceae bacterium]
PEEPHPQSEAMPAPADAATPAPDPSSPGFLDGLTSHFDGTCGPTRGGVFSADVEYLWWVLRNAKVPVALASTNALGVTGSETLIGEHDLRYDHRPSSGFRVSLAYWREDPVPELDWDRPRTVGVEANYFFLGERGISMPNDTAPTIIRPFFALNTRSESGSVVAAPGIATGGITATANYGLWGTELNFLKNIYYEYPGKTVRLDFFAGFRYLDLGEDLSVTGLSVYTQQPGGVFQQFAGNQLLQNDLFSTRDQFYGGQIGATAKFFLEILDVNVSGKVAFGGTAEELHIDGFQMRTLANGTVVPSTGGLLALPSNIGRYHRGDFAVVPEFDISGSYVICRHVSLTAGYQFMFWSKVLRPADQIDRVIDVTQIPNFPITGIAPTGQARPSVPFHETQFWAQGVNVALQIVW